TKPLYKTRAPPNRRCRSEPMGTDEQLAKAGFTNLLYNNIPMVVDSHCNTVRAGTTGDSLYMLNEDYIELCVSPRADMKLEDFQPAINQDAAVAKLLWAGNLIFKNVK